MIKGYLYGKVKPILELETRDLCWELELAGKDSVGSILELTNASLGGVSTFTTYSY